MRVKPSLATSRLIQGRNSCQTPEPTLEFQVHGHGSVVTDPAGRGVKTNYVVLSFELRGRRYICRIQEQDARTMVEGLSKCFSQKSLRVG